jgi:hypothetical protein
MINETENVQFLTMDELCEIEAGQNIFYYLGYGLGYAAYCYYESQLSITNGTGSNMRR